MENFLLNETALDEFTKTQKRLKIWMAFLVAIVGAEFMAANEAKLIPWYFSCALADICTMLLGIGLVCRSYLGVHRILWFIAMAALNCLVHVLRFINITTGYPGAQNFFSTSCFMEVHLIKNGHQETETIDLCSFQTVLGNLAILTGIFVQFMCGRCAWKMFKITHAASSSLLPMINTEMPRSDLESAMFLNHLQGNSASPPEAGASNAQFSGARGGCEGFTPFSGQPHHLGDD